MRLMRSKCISTNEFSGDIDADTAIYFGVEVVLGEYIVIPYHPFWAVLSSI